MKIYLIGMMLSGKSTIGKILSQKLNLDYVDLDKYIEKKFNESIPLMFEKGESYFRDRETLSLKDFIDKDNIVISCGGGIITRDENKDLMNGKVIYLESDINDLILRSKNSNEIRPLLKSNDISKLYEKRKEAYLRFKDYSILNKDINETINEIVRYLDENISN